MERCRHSLKFQSQYSLYAFVFTLVINHQFDNQASISAVMSFVLVKNSAKTITTLTNVFFGSVPRPQKLKSRSIKNAKKITYSEWKSFAFETITFLCNVTCLVLVTIYSEFRDWISEEDELWFISDSMLVSAVFSVIFHTMSYVNDVKVENLSDQDEEEKPIYVSDVLYGISQALFLLMHPNQFLAGYEFSGSLFRDLNTLLTTISYFRIIFIYCYLSKNSRYYGTRISRLLSVYGHRSKATNFMYAIKCLFKEKGMLANTFLLTFTITFLGVISILVSAENSIVTQMYYCVETMATIGYGEFAIKNSVERLIFVLVIISGSFAASVFTIDLLEFLDLQDKQFKAYRLIKRLQFQNTIRESKLQTIQKFFQSSKQPYKKRAISVWKQYEKELQVDKSPILEYLTIKYTYFCNSLKMLLERQLLSSSLLTFYLNRRSNYDIWQQQKVDNGHARPNSKRRVEDSYKLYAVKEKILGYRR